MNYLYFDYNVYHYKNKTKKHNERLTYDLLEMFKKIKEENKNKKKKKKKDKRFIITF
jgi:hypothetical protein